MSDHKQVVWFADDPIPNRFFFRSPFRSWRFVVNTAVLVTFLFVCAIVLNKNRSSLSKFFWAVFVMLQGAVYPYLRVLQSHRKINELYLAGKITDQPAGTSIDELFNVANNALNDGFFFSTVVMGSLVVFGFLIPLK
jgi:hypothetical protein